MRPRTLALVAPLFFWSCIYIHDSPRQKLANETKASFESIATGTPNGDPVKHFVEYRDAIAALTSELHTAREAAELNILLDKTWDEIRVDAESIKKTTEKDIEAEKETIRTLDETLKKRLASLPGLSENVASLGKAMTAASRKAAEHSATQELLRHALVAVVDGEPDSFSNLRKVLETKKTFTEFKIAEDEIKPESKEVTVGELVGIPLEKLPTSPPKTIAELDAWSAALGAIAKMTRPGLNLRDPGIATTVIGLGLDVAMAEEKRARTEIEAAKSERKERRDLLKDLESRSELFGRTDIKQLIAADRVKPKETLREGLQRISNDFRADLAEPDPSKRDPNKRSRLNTVLQAVATDYRARVLADRTIEMRRDRIQNGIAERDLVIAATNLSEREAVIGRGMEGLVAFHGGGLNDADVKSVIGVAQAAGLFALGGL